jgi:molybdopterin synthase catalytic subunit
MSEPVFDIKLVRGPVRDHAWEPFPQAGGAECVFLGRTRSEAHPKHGELIELHYEAYEEMALGVLKELARKAASKFDCLAVRVHHAVGDVPIGEASVVVNVVCDHRDMAFVACRFLIDSLKEQAPIWKQEVWADGTTWAAGTLVPNR